MPTGIGSRSVRNYPALTKFDQCDAPRLRTFDTMPITLPPPVEGPSRQREMELDSRARPRSPLTSNRWVRATRPQQWVKATLVLIAPLLAFNFSITLLGRLVAAAFLACGAASGTYLLNDAIDAPADRLHPVKRLRPVAAGEIGRRQAVVIGCVLLVAAPTIGLLLGLATGLAIEAYVLLTVAYTLRLKRIPVVDVLVISAGFVIRVLIGGFATSTPIAAWFLVAVAAAAVMVATGKRRGELSELGLDAIAHRRTLTAYDAKLTSRMLVGAACALCAGLLGWATVGAGGPHLGQAWAVAILVPAMVGIGRYLRLAVTGQAAKPEALVHDHLLQIAAASTTVVFLVGRIMS